MRGVLLPMTCATVSIREVARYSRCGDSALRPACALYKRGTRVRGSTSAVTISFWSIRTGAAPPGSVSARVAASSAGASRGTSRCLRSTPSMMRLCTGAAMFARSCWRRSRRSGRCEKCSNNVNMGGEIPRRFSRRRALRTQPSHGESPGSRARIHKRFHTSSCVSRPASACASPSHFSKALSCTPHARGHTMRFLELIRGQVSSVAVVVCEAAALRARKEVPRKKRRRVQTAPSHCTARPGTLPQPSRACGCIREF